MDSFVKLDQNLKALIGLYRQFLEVLRHEKDFLIQADVQKLAENNEAKESLIYKIRATDTTREKLAIEAALACGADAKAPRLLELARTVGGDWGDKLRLSHATLETLVGRCIQLNKDNETYTAKALEALNGAMGNIKDTLGGKKTYGQGGKMTQAGPENAGNFVSKEA